MVGKMNLIKKQVKHKTYGLGNVVDLSNSFIEIQFDSGLKKFIFPDAFGTYLFLTDKKLAHFVNEKKKRMQLEAKRKKMREAVARATRTKELRIRMQNENLLKNLRLNPSSQVVFWCNDNEIAEIFNVWNISTGAIKSGKNKGKINRLARLHRNSACLLTARSLEEPEQQRRIIGVFMVQSEFIGKLCEDGIIEAHKDFRIKLTEIESQEMLFWKFYLNKRSPLRMTWNQGRHRYFDNIIMAQILKEIVLLKNKTPEREIAQRFYDHFCSINRIDKTSIPEPGGPLVQN